MFLNTKVPPFDDVDVRRALNLAVDREVVQQTFGGSEHATITCQILPPGIQGFAPYCPYTAEPGPSGQWHAPDLQRAKRLLRGKERVPVIVWGFDDVADTAEHIAAVLSDLGYPVEHRTLPFERFFGKVMTEPDVQAGVFGWFADLPGAFSFVAPTLGCAAARSPDAANYAHHCDPAIDRLGNKAARLQFSDPRRANELWARIDRRLTRTAAWVPLVNTKGVELVSDRVGNYTYNPVTGIVLSEAWVK